MSYCRKEGKDMILFVTEEDQKGPSTIEFTTEDDPPPGPVLEDGGINWNCPCLGGMAAGPCGVEFREAFSCFHYSTAEPKGSDCMEPFRAMSECMGEYPGVYGGKEAGGDAINLNEDDTTTMKSATTNNTVEDTNGNSKAVAT